jgi:signal transduction histidine kinase
MNKELWGSKELFGITSRLVSIMSLPDVDSILQEAIVQLTNIIGASSCSIYLVPDYLKKFDGYLFRDGQIIQYETLKKRCVILAATNQEEIKQWLYKGFYSAEEGVTGWVYEHKIPLNIKNVLDQKELNSFSKTLVANDVYKEGTEDLSRYRKRPLLVMPLYTNERSLGVIKVSGKQPRFTEFDEKVVQQGSLIVSHAIYNATEFSRHQNSILELIEVGAKRDLEEIMLEASNGLRDLLHGEISHIYLPVDSTNKSLALWIENGKQVNVKRKWERGSSLIGWVYKTGKPLIIDDTRLYNSPHELSDDLLENISDSSLIDPDDRYIQRQEPYAILHDEVPITFLAVPIKQDGEVLGVISVQSKYGNSYPRSTPFNRMDLQLIESIGRIILNSIESDQKKILSELFIEMGFISDLGKLYATVIDRLPKIVSSSGCSIFEYVQDAHGRKLALIATTRKGWVVSGFPKKIDYSIAQGKTGFCGLTKSTLIVNHFGAGDLSDTRMDDEIEKILFRYPSDLIERLIDNNGIQVGIMQLRNGTKINNEIKEQFKKLKKSQRLTEKGLPTVNETLIDMYEYESSWSFAAIPIKSNGDLLGVITVGRPVPQNPFSIADITIIESIAGRLATVIGNIRMQEEKKELFMSLAHEINTPLTGILAESENLMVELKGQKELAKLARENLEQVLRLHLLTETIMGVLSAGEIVREFKYQNIGAVLRVACSLFQAEAIHKGCDIMEPRPVDGEFPEIEMSEFDILIALKNIVHNAVKYSFEPSARQEKNRYIKIWGGYTDSTKRQYRVNIQNYGIGISKDDLDSRKIFEPFYRGNNAGDRRRTGAGFGLAHARRMIEDLHLGKIEATSVPLIGSAHLTTFSIALPIHRRYV